MPPFIDLTGLRFGRLTVLRRDADGASRQPKWLCLCDCGSEAVVFGNSLRGGITQSCGCLHKEAVSVHGMTGSPEFTIWQMMRQRCSNPAHKSYPSYGGRGIRVCERWEESFANFLADVGPRPSPRHTLDRRDNDGGYSPENCEWATPAEQSRNKRNNRRLTLRGETLTLSEWSERLGIPKSTLVNRLERGLSDEEALTRPVRPHVRRVKRSSAGTPRSSP